VGFYSQTIFPRLCDFLLSGPFIAHYRRQLLAHAFGDVLEIGFGTGLNLPHYPRNIRKITTVDPNVGMYRLARKRIELAGIAVDQRVVSGERLPFEDNTFDCVVSTFTLCSIDDVGRALAEAYRVLKPGGKFLFLEHGLSPQPSVQKWQRRLNWLEMRLAGGCRLDRPIKQLVAAQPFSSLQVEEFHLEWTPRTHGHIYRGLAGK
jgi:ubiquinone/menaquinone biosynthesis C-methylase UbiE